MDVYERVDLGIEILNQFAEEGIISPKWAQEIDLESLSLTDGDNCILGQVFAEKGHANDMNGYLYAILRHQFDKRPFHAFYNSPNEINVGDDPDEVRFPDLERAWFERLTEMQM